MLFAADWFDMNDLKDKICDLVRKHIDKDNVLDIAGLAELYDAKRLSSLCVEFLVEQNIKIEAADVKENPILIMKVLDWYKKDMKQMADQVKCLEGITKMKDEEIDKRMNALPVYLKWDPEIFKLEITYTYHAKRLSSLCVEFLVEQNIKIEAAVVKKNPSLILKLLDLYKNEVKQMAEQLKCLEGIIKKKDEVIEIGKLRKVLQDFPWGFFP